MNAISRYAQASVGYTAKVQASLDLLTQTRHDHAGAWTQANSLGAEDVVITHLMHLSGWLHQADASVFVLNTEKLHEQTIALISQIERRYSITVKQFKPEAVETIALVERIGENGIFESKDKRLSCCDVRKMQPLSKALAGQVGWLTGLRREQSMGRAQVNSLEQDGPRLKLNPLVNWSWGDVWAFIAEHDLSYNALHDDFFPSIGCAPCTRAISLGEDFRAGRWWWEANDGQSPAKECGLHVQPTTATTTTTSTTVSQGTTI